MSLVARHPLNPLFDQYPNGACQLMLAAERLFGQHGLEGVTISELLKAAGQANKSAVQHYFGSKEGLLEAARDMRVPQLEQARTRWVEQLPAPGADQVSSYLAALFLPVLEIMDDRELQSFSQLNQRLLHAGASDQSIMRLAAASPMTQRIISGLYACCPGMTEALFKARLRLAVGVLLGGVAEWRRLSESSDGMPYPSEAVFWTDMLVAASGVLCAPAARQALPVAASLVRPKPQRRTGTAKATRRTPVPAR
ncbi:MAG: TetR/AcrR family transcriptional regulator [Polaromonas sp.]|nr:TetR/AcrR family transcriptional regulator [Polaromonas sp.]